MRLHASLLLVLAVAASAQQHIARQASAPVSSTPTPTPTTLPSTLPSSTPTSTPSSSTTPTTTPTTTSTPTTTPPTTTPTTPTTVAPPRISTITDADGGEVTVTVTSSKSASSTSSSAKPSKTADDSSGDESAGLSMGSVVGMSVAGGLALIGIVAFFVWKFTRKRTSFDDNEAIKWPELNSHSGTAGVDTPAVSNTARSGYDNSDTNSLARMNTDNYSTADFAHSQDPYAVPPLPHLNPNQPYRDDPSQPAGYYDPYRGPVPSTMDHGSDQWHGESIPMNQIHGGPGYEPVGYEQAPYNTAGRASPGPQAAFAQDPYGAGRTASPAPFQQGGYEAGAYGGRTSPGPNVAYAERASPGPHAAYGAGYPQGGAGYGR